MSTKFTDVVFSNSLTQVDNFCHVMGKLLLPSTTLKCIPSTQFRGYRPERIWILESTRMLDSLYGADYEKYQRARALLVATAFKGCDIIVVSDWR